jgi:Protein of unknown function (DUF2474)
MERRADAIPADAGATRWWRRFAWLAALWLAGVAAMGVLALAIREVMAWAGLTH